MRAIIFFLASIVAIATPAQTATTDEQKRDVLYTTCHDEGCRAYIRKLTGTMLCEDADAGWIVSKHRDPMTDETTCTVSPKSPTKDSYFIALFIGGHMSFGVGGNDYPGRRKSIRIDSNPAFTFDDFLRGSAAKKAFTQIRTGSVIKTQMIEWPSGAPVNYSAPICGLPALLEDCQSP